MIEQLVRLVPPGSHVHCPPSQHSPNSRPKRSSSIDLNPVGQYCRHIDIVTRPYHSMAKRNTSPSSLNQPSEHFCSFRCHTGCPISKRNAEESWISSSVFGKRGNGADDTRSDTRIFEICLFRVVGLTQRWGVFDRDMTYRFLFQCR